MQSLRNICCFLGQPFVEVHLDRYDQQKATLPIEVRQQLKRFKLDQENLPALIHGDNFVEGPRVTAAYLCVYFNRK
jgi:hypothetical protein